MYVGDRDELAEVTWTEFTQAEQQMQPYSHASGNVLAAPKGPFDDVCPIDHSRYHAGVPPARSGSFGLRYASHEHALLRISKLDKKTILSLAEGVHLVSSTGRAIDDLRHQVSADRLRFARELLITGDKLRRSRPPQYRSAVSRYYYCMYHSMRAVVYFAHGGDDYQPHSDLPARIPTDFIEGGLWRNALKDAQIPPE